MGIKELYFNLEEKFQKSIDVIDAHLPIRWLTDAIDKVIPTFVLVHLLLLVAIILLIVFLIPHSQNIEFVFKSQNIQVIDSFGFVFTVDGKEYSANANKGVAEIEVKEGKVISLESLNTKEYSIDQKLYDFSETITVKLNKVVNLIPVSVFLFNEDGSSFNRSANLNFSCNSGDLSEDESKKTVSNGNLVVNVPKDCGTLNISAQADGYLLKSGQVCDNTTCSLEFSPVTQINLSGNLNLPNGGIKVSVYDDLGNAVNGARVKVYDASDLKNEIDVTSTNALGVTKTFSGLTVGRYQVYVSYSGFKDSYLELNVTDNSVSEAKIVLSKLSLGTIKVVFENVTNNKNVSGSLALKDNTGNIIYRATTNGTLDLPVYSYGTFLVDFDPDDNSLFPVANKSVTISSTTKDLTIWVNKITQFNFAKVNIYVNDEDGKPVEGAKVFVRDGITNFDILSYDGENGDTTDSNGHIWYRLEKGVYSFRAYTGFAEAISEAITVTTQNSGTTPEINVNITLAFGYSMLNITVLDEYHEPMPEAKITFYKQYTSDSDDIVITNVQGKANHSFKAGVPIYFVVDADDYQTYYSESRLLINNYMWDVNVVMEPRTPDKDARVEFLGLYKTIGGDESKAMAIGGSYYVGFRIHNYNVPTDSMKFTINAGNLNEDVEKEKIYLTDAYTSADFDTKYSDFAKEKYTNGDAKIIISEWENNLTTGNYDLYYKVQVRPDSSVKLYDSLQLSWQLVIDDGNPIGETKDFLAGSKTICAEDSFCGRYTMLDKTTDLYVDPVTQDNFILSPGNNYKLDFDLINGIGGSNGEIKNGILQIYNALSNDESLVTVKNNISTRSFIELSSYNLSGPNDNDKQSNFVDKFFGVFVENYPFTLLLKNRYISGDLDIKPVLTGNSYLNFVVLDNDRKIVVQGKPALSLKINAISEKKINIILFPDRVLAPYLNQTLKVFAKDDSNSNIKDALVSIRLKKQGDSKYKVLDYCRDMNTNAEGYINCNLQAYDLEPDTRLQVIVTKEGYKGYSRDDLTADLQVSTKLFDFDKEELEASLIYPVQPEYFDSVTVTNNSASNITIDHVELQFNNYNQDAQNLLNVDEMKNWASNTNLGKVINGRQLNYDNSGVLDGEAKTELKQVFKAALNEQLGKEINASETVSGAMIFYFKTESELITRTLPFSVVITSDGYPTNAGDNCLALAFLDGKESFVSDSGKVINMPLEVINNCFIDKINEQQNAVHIPAVLDEAYIVLTHKSGSLSLGSYFFSPGQGSGTDLVYSVPKSFITNWSSDVNPSLISSITFTPRSMGKESLSLKLIANIKTSQGIQKIESNEVPFNVSVMKIEDCIKVYNDLGEEIDYLTLAPEENSVDTTDINPTGNEFSITLKNMCEGLSLDVDVCKDNKYQIPKSCGEESDSQDYIGFKFGNGDDKYTSFTLNTEEKLNISRPTVSGAYALEIYASQLGDTSSKRVIFLPINVQTAEPYNYLFVEEPYLETTEQDGYISDNFWIPDNFLPCDDCRQTDTVAVYNIDVPGNMKITDKNIFATILAQSDEDNKEIFFGNITELLNKGNNNGSEAGGLFIGGSGLIATATIGMGVWWAIAGSASLVPGFGWLIGGGMAVIGSIMTVVATFQTHIDDTQENKFVIIDSSVDYPFVPVNYSSNKIDIGQGKINYNEVFKVTGQDKYIYNIVGESIDGYVATGSTSWTDRLKFNVSCMSSDYEVDEENIMVLDKTDSFKGRSFDSCWWNQLPTVSGNTVTFYPACSGSWFEDVGMNTFVVVPCKLKSEYWGRANHGGIEGDLGQNGIFKLQFNNIDFGDCNSEWCFKTYDIKMDGGLLGKYNSTFRFAFRNPKPDSQIVTQTGTPCTNISGDIVGFTGSNAKPKVEFDWSSNLTDINYCTPYDENNDVKRYCDATQLMISNLYRLQNAQKELESIANSPQCKDITPNTTISSNDIDDSANYFTDLKIYRNEENPKKIMLRLSKDLNVYTPPITFKYKLIFNVNGNTNTQDVTLQSEQAQNGQERLFFSLDKEIGEIPEDLNQGGNKILDQSIDITIQKCDLLNNCSTDQSTKLTYKVFADYFPGGCLIKNPSTEVPSSTGKMILFSFYDLNNDYTEDVLFKVQDLLHYRAYLMQDGYSKDFLNDLYDSINSTFLSNYDDLLSEDGLDLGKLISEDRIKVINDLGGSKLLGSGLYEVHVNVAYPENSINIKDSNIVIVLDRIKSAVNDNIFYYIPIDGSVGFDGTTLDRQGYGVDFSNDVVQISDTSIDPELLSQLSSNSTPVSHLNVSKDIAFSEMNGKKRGTLFEANKNSSEGSNDISILFVPNINYTKFYYNMNNLNVDVDTGLYYSLSYYGTPQYGDSISLPWYVNESDYENYDFTGELLMQSYPKISIAEDNIAKLVYPGTSVTNLKNYNIYTFVFGKSGSNIVVRKERTENLNNSYEINKEAKNLDIESMNDILTGIDDGRLCITKSSNNLNTRVFVNEYKLTHPEFNPNN